MIVEKVFKCCTFCLGYKGIENLILELKEELDKGYHIVDIEQEYHTFAGDELDPNLIIILRKEIK